MMKGRPFSGLDCAFSVIENDRHPIEYMTSITANLRCNVKGCLFLMMMFLQLIKAAVQSGRDRAFNSADRYELVFD